MESLYEFGEPEITESVTNFDTLDNESKSDMQDDLDMSWLDEQERIQNIQANHFREPMGSIHMKFIYINQNQYIDNIIHETHTLEELMDSTGSVLSNNILLRLIQSKKLVTPVSKYKLIDILLYHVDLEPEHIQSYSKSDDFIEHSAGFFKVLPIIKDIQISPSVFIFHSTNTLYFIFQEVETQRTNNKVILKSILKTRKNHEFDVKSADSVENLGSQKPLHNTKKVQIVEKSRSNKHTMARKTRKKYNYA